MMIPKPACAAFEAGAYRYLTKPFDTRELVMILKSLEKARGIHGERNWLVTLADIGKELQGGATSKEVGQIVVQAAPKLGFERARLWLYKTETVALVGLAQQGNIGLEGFEGFSIPLNEMPYSQEALQKGEPVIFKGDEYGQSKLDQEFGGQGFKVAVGQRIKIPLLNGARWLGVLTLDNAEQTQTYTEEQRELLRLLGNQATSALARAQNQEEDKTLSDIGRMVTTKAAQGSLDELLREVYQQVARLMDVSNFMVVLTDPDPSLLDFRFNYEKGASVQQQWRDPKCGLVGYLITEGKKSLWLPDGSEEAFRREHNIPDCGEMSQCWLGVPLQTETGEIFGALVVQHYITRVSTMKSTCVC